MGVAILKKKLSEEVNLFNAKIISSEKKKFAILGPDYYSKFSGHNFSSEKDLEKNLRFEQVFFIIHDKVH